MTVSCECPIVTVACAWKSPVSSWTMRPTRCRVDYRGVSQCRLRLVSDAKPVGPNLWKGHILDPRNGKLFGVELHLDPRGNLALRGFLGLPVFGQTQLWTPYPGVVPGDCRMSTSMAAAATLPPMPERER